MTQAYTEDIIVVGGAYTDYIMRGLRLPTEGETTLGDIFLEIPGSKASNQAVEAMRLGARVALVACVGNDARGETIIHQLNEEQVDTRYLVRDATTPTGISLIHVNEQGNRQTMVMPGASYRLNEEDIRRAEEAIHAAKILLTQLEIPLSVARAAMLLAHQAGVQVIFEPTPVAPVPDDLFPLIDIIRLDAKEAQTLTGIVVRERTNAQCAAEQLLQQGVRMVAIQVGDTGDLLVWPQGSYWSPRIPVRRMDSTGAGDAFAAALATALAESRSIPEAARFASAAAALTTTRFGARPALPRRNEVLALLAR